MLGGSPDARHLTMAVMTDGWLTDQLTNNAGSDERSMAREYYERIGYPW
jgi:hypothetical protein